MRDNETEWEFRSRIINEVWDKDEPKENAEIEHKKNFVFSDDQALNLAKELNKQPMVDSQFTISDDVLFEQATVAMEEVYGSGCETEIDAYFRGAKWMLKQLKNK